MKQAGEKVRGKYTSRKEHYEEEFNKICEVQNISDSLKADLYKAIFFQRKLKSQKFLVADNNESPTLFDDLQANYSKDNKLTKEEIDLIRPLFFRISKPNFDFKDISKILRKINDEWTFNYRDDTNNDWKGYL